MDDNQQKPPQSTDLIFAIFFLIVVAGGTAWTIYIIDARFAAALVDCFVMLARGPGY